MKKVSVLLMLFVCFQAFAKSCDAQGVWLQVLGAGGPELNDGFASSGYVLWHDGRSRVLVENR